MVVGLKIFQGGGFLGFYKHKVGTLSDSTAEVIITFVMSPSYPQRERPQHGNRPSWLLLKRLDQVAVAGLVMAALLSVGAYWVTQGGLSGRLIELDRAPRTSVAFEVDINSADWPEQSSLKVCES